MRPIVGWLGLALAALVCCSCRQDTSSGLAATANDVKEPAEPLAAATKAVPAGKVRVELVRSQPAGARDNAEYEWVLLMPLSPQDMGKALLGLATPKEAGWSVLRLTLRAAYEKQYDDRAITKDGTLAKPGARHIGLTVQLAEVYYYPGSSNGTGSTSGHMPPGGVLTLERSGPSGGRVKSGLAPLTRRLDLLEVGQASLDNLVEPLFKGPETIDLPVTLELLRIGDTRSKLAIDP